MPTVSPGSVIYGSDYNVVQGLLTQVLGTGSPYGPSTLIVDYGYNQPLVSSLVNVGQVITADQWNKLTADLNKVYKHQTNTDWPSYSTANVNQTTGQTITAANYNTVFNAVVALADTRLTVAPAQLVTSTIGTTTRSGSWGTGGDTGIQNSGSITFASANDLQYFFNQGGRINLSGIAPSNSGSSQDSAWITASSAFSYTIDYVENSVLSGSYTLRYNQTGQPSPYSGNYIHVHTYRSGATIYWQVEFEDAHANSYSDGVSGGIGYTLSISTATGAFTGTTYSSVSLNGTWTTGTFS